MINWIYDIREIKTRAGERIKYFLRLQEGGLDKNRLLKEIDKDIHSDLIEDMAENVFNEILKRHSKSLSNTFYVGNDVNDSTKEIIQFTTNDFTDESVMYIDEVDRLIKKALKFGLCYEWFKASGFGPGTEYFSAEFDKAKIEAKSSSLDLHTRDKYYNPIY